LRQSTTRRVDNRGGTLIVARLALALDTYCRHLYAGRQDAGWCRQFYPIGA
jgi:hypothetical protein